IPAGDLVPLLEPVDALGLLRPEPVHVGERAIVEGAVAVLRADAGLLGEGGWNADEALSLGVGHARLLLRASECTLSSCVELDTRALPIASCSPHARADSSPARRESRRSSSLAHLCHLRFRRPRPAGRRRGNPAPWPARPGSDRAFVRRSPRIRGA